MKIRQRKKLITIFYVAGFLAGILYANLIARQYITSTGIFSEYFLGEYLDIDVVAEEFIAYILQIRVLPLVLFVTAGQTKFRKPAIVSWLIWIGFSSGVLIVAAIVQLGVKGVLLCLIGVTPQFVFYILSYVVVIWYFYTYPSSVWNNGKTVFVVLTMALGILSEVYINPILMKMFINAM